MSDSLMDALLASIEGGGKINFCGSVELLPVLLELT